MSYTIGANVQVHVSLIQTNSSAPQILDTIYLLPVQNMQGGHILL